VRLDDLIPLSKVGARFAADDHEWTVNDELETVHKFQTERLALSSEQVLVVQY